jgi:hypothetical protein
MDDLRDYRFYENDLLHPTSTAVEYIQSHFAQTFFNKETTTLVKKIEKIRQALAHRPFNPHTPQHLAFLENIHQQINALKEENPEILFDWS